MSSSAETQLLQDEVNHLKLGLKNLQAETGTELIPVGQYLLDRLAQLGVSSMFGVPGDFNLGFLDLVEDHPTINWVGNCNELNGAYAADGYARVKQRSLGVVLTTFGVGELSAANGIAGAFSEMVPVLHIAGVPRTDQQKTKLMLHHTLGDGRYDAYIKAAEQFVCSTAVLTNAQDAPAQIDRILIDCITKARPVYMTLPTDITYAKVSSERLKIPLTRAPPSTESDVQDFVIKEIMKLVEDADGDAILLIDACTIRHHVVEEVRELALKTRLPVYAAPMGKSAIPESYERYGGIYVGSLTRPDILEKVENAKLIISIGAVKSDFNTGNFTYHIPTARTVELHSDHTKVQYATFPDVGMKQLIPKLTAHLESYYKDAQPIPVNKWESILPDDASEVISQAYFWPRMSRFFRPKDVIVAETGTSSFGVLDIPLPDESVFVSQILWGSIGWTVGSTLGAAIAAREVGLGRTILFIGDGSLQVTVQDLATMIRQDLKPIIFLLNNSGYTIERFLHGKERKYNDIINWEWTKLLNVLGDIDGSKSKSYTVKTRQDLSSLLENSEFSDAGKIQLVEVLMEQFDAPNALKNQAELSGKANSYSAV